MRELTISVGPFKFIGRLEAEAASATCEVFETWLPFESRVIHSRWSGGAVWIPLDDEETSLAFENHTSHPSAGEILLYPGGYTGAEILFAYDGASFSSKMGPLAGNHFLTIVSGRERLAEMGEFVLWRGAQEIVFRSRPTP